MRRIPDMQTLRTEVAAWEDERNETASTIGWRFTTDDARIKLKRLYPTVREEEQHARICPRPRKEGSDRRRRRHLRGGSGHPGPETLSTFIAAWRGPRRPEHSIAPKHLGGRLLRTFTSLPVGGRT